MDCEQVKILLMAKEDGEITIPQQEQLQEQLSSCQDCQCLRNWQNFVKMERQMYSLEFIEPQEQAWQLYWNNIYNRLEWQIGIILSSCGAALLILYAIYEFCKELWWSPDVPTIVKFGLATFVVGITITIVSIVRERFILRKHDPFERIEK